MAQAKKEEFVAKMRRDVERAAGVLFVNYTGLTVLQANALRAQLRAEQVSYQVVKNSLMTRVLADTSYAEASKCLKGTPTGVVLGFEDPVTPAKITFAFLKECDKIKVKGGIVDGCAISAVEAEALSKLPSREELQGMVVTYANSPGSKLAGALKSPAGRIVGAIDALVERHGPEADGAAASAES